MSRDRGSADALGLVLIAPVVIGLAVLVVALGRGVDARAQVRSAAESGAQAAALERTPSAAKLAGEEVAKAMLTDPDTCSNPAVSVDLADFRAGGIVGVSVSCSVSNRGIEVIQSGSRVQAVVAYATVDFFRGSEQP